MCDHFCVIGGPIGSFVGGFMFKNIGSIASFKILSFIALVMFITQISINYLIDNLTKNKDNKDIYSKVDTKDNNIEENTEL